MAGPSELASILELLSHGGVESRGHSLFETDLGNLDCLGAIEEARTFDDLVPLSIEIDLDRCPIRVLGLETIVRLKRESTHAKDKLALLILEETLTKLHRRS